MTDRRVASSTASGPPAEPQDASREVVRALARRGRAASSVSTPPAGCPRRRPPSCWRRTGRTRFPPRSRRRGGSCSWPSTGPTCRSSSSAAAVASMVIGEIATGVAVLLITALNALGGLRQQGKAESAMNALQSMLKTTARVRRDGTEVKVDADQVVVGDVVLLAAGDDVCADGRLVEATSLQIDESALTGESVPASKSTEVVTDQNPVLGDQSNMAFMNTPVTHGSGVMIVTGTGADTAVGTISGMLKSAPNLKTPMTKQLDTLTLWIAAAAGLTIAIMFALGISRGRVGPDDLHDGHRAGARRGADGHADGAAGDPVQRVAGAGRARRRGEEPRLGGDPRLDVGDQLGQDRHADDEPGHRRRGDRPHRPVRDHRHGLRARRRGPAHRRQHEHDRGGDPAVPDHQRRQARQRQGRGRPHRGRAAGPRAQGEARHRGHAGGLPPARDPAVRPHLQADGRLLRRQGRVGQPRRPGLRQGCRPGRDRAGHLRPRQGRVHPLGRAAERSAPTRRRHASAARACASWPRP